MSQLNNDKQTILNRMIETGIAIKQLEHAIDIAIGLGDKRSVDVLSQAQEAREMDLEDYQENLETVNREIAKAERILNKVING